MTAETPPKPGAFARPYGRPRRNFDEQDKNSPLQAFGVQTRFALNDVLEPGIDEAIRFAAQHAPDYFEALRYRLYLHCKFAELTVSVPGDLIFAGVSYGKSTHAVLKYLGDRLGKKKTWLIDRWDGRFTMRDERVKAAYCADVSIVRDAFAYADVQIIEDYIPSGLGSVSSTALSFVALNTGDVDAHVDSLPALLKRLSPGGIIISGNFAQTAETIAAHAKAVKSSGVETTTINLLNGHGVFVRNR